MIVQKSAKSDVQNSKNRTQTWLNRAKSGEIPVNLLEKLSLDRRETISFIHANIPLLSSSAKGAGLGTLAIFFEELNNVLKQA
jgi:hypothetical protein